MRLPFAQAIAIIRDNATVEEVADLLMKRAKAVYLVNRMLKHMGDDTTVMVIDLNPSGIKFAKRGGGGEGGGGGGCCTIA